MRLSFAAGLFWLSVACCAFAQFFILRSVSGSSRRQVPEPSAAMPPRRGVTELVWAVVPALALALLLAVTWRAVQTRAQLSQPAEPGVERAR
jgi:heme/copper-type cytochrome/quinol oxidase subunit 2